MSNVFSPKKFFKSFGYALNGLKQALKLGQNLKVQLFAAIIAIILACFLHCSVVEFVAILLCIGAVLSLEIINTAIEECCNFISPQYHNKIKLIKDLSAAAVLVMSLIALIVGAVIFLPKLVHCC